ncbi:MAG TPA: hypothetical protein VJQ54_06845, partial [Candidatus Sulfotelmatobacter sp.]|nr:hypothetical protein [Candidatus Sulfotelmatobacter sp.]
NMLIVGSSREPECFRCSCATGNQHESNAASDDAFGLSYGLSMLTLFQTIDVALGLALVIVLGRSTAAEFRKLWKH